jgi:tetratricopeptide (TPR) repeat protein
MPMNEKVSAAIQTDNINNKDAAAYNNDDLMGAIKYFEQALLIMPNNDDALKNLRVCYSEIGNQSKVKEIEKKLD